MWSNAGNLKNYAILFVTMKSSREFWHRWAESLRRYQLHELVASILEAGSPFALLGAQAIYFSEGFIHSDQLTALAGMLEDETEAHEFASFLAAEGAMV